ncbi:DNA primase [Marinimicrobium sp. ABcell2]|uniref:DNA primase n=1 Tax=Marinimicrobium sp. ABcell2 TaxID=3069751 RepID=UPI0027AEDAE1|nr:DNA primase [Marinimicrobium sp. ABcell2]MDQ2077405.1 DNA primase [Marinimicrobium sp. ABcell2]
MAFSDDFIQRVRNAVDIVDEIGLVVDLKKQGKNHFACCPFHEEKTPSFSIDASKQLYFCHGACGDGGDIFKFTMQQHNVEFPEAVAMLAEKAGIPLENENGRSKSQDSSTGLYDTLSQAEEYFQTQLTGHTDVQALLLQRGVTAETVNRFGLGAAGKGWRGVIDHIGSDKHFKALVDSGLAIYKPKTSEEKGRFYDRFRDALIFPIRDERGRTVSFARRRLEDGPAEGAKAPPKYINGPETSVFKKSAVAYGLYEALQADRSPSQLVVTEGYMDVVTSHQNGLTNHVATMGVAINVDLAKRLFKRTENLVFCFDGDKAGRTAAVRALHAVLPLLDDKRRASFVLLPEGADPDSMIREQGVEAYTQHLKLSTIPASDLILRTAQDGVVSLDTSEGRGQMFSNAKVMLDQMPPSVTKSHVLKRLESVTAIKPTEYMPFSFEMQEGHCHGVDLPALEQEVREFIANKIGVGKADVRVNWSMPELGPHRAQSTPDLKGLDVQRELGVRMREVARTLMLETPVTQGLNLKQVMNSARNSSGEHKMMAQALLSRYFRDTPAFETQCQLASYHMTVIKDNLKLVAPNMNEEASAQMKRWCSSVKGNADNLVAALSELEPTTAARVERYIDLIGEQAEQTSNTLGGMTESQQIDPAPSEAKGATREV